MAKNNVARAAIHAAAQTSLHPAQVNENTRDGWDKEKYDNKNLDTSHHYDVTRKNLNFVVDAEGIKPLSTTNTEKMYNRYIERLRELDFKAYDPDATNQPNSYIDWVFSGDHDVMHKMAFGDQDVALDLSRDNSHIVRKPEIEEFAKAVYGFACQKFGVDNVVGAEVHLDETTPHIHINVIPTAMRMQRGRATSLYVHKDDPNNTITSKEYKNLSKTARKNWMKGPKLERTQKLCVSFSGMVGENRTERGKYLKRFHTDFFEQVGARFGLARGREKETLSEEELKNRRHKTSAELEAERQQQIKEAMKLDAVIQGKKKEKENLTDDNAKLKKKNESLKAEYDEKQNELSEVEGDIYWKEKELDKVNENKDNAEREVLNLNSKKENLQKDITSLRDEYDEAQEKLDEIKSQVSLASAELDKKNAEIARADSKIESANDRIRAAEQKASAKESEATSRINQAESQASQKEREVAAIQGSIDRDRKVAEEKLRILNTFALAAEVKQASLKCPTLNLSEEEQKLINDITAEMNTPVGTLQSAKSWAKDRKNNIKSLVETFNKSVDSKVTTENENVTTYADKIFTYYMQKVNMLKKENPYLSEVADAKGKADILRALLKGLEQEELSMYVDESPDELGKVIKNRYDQQLKGMSDYLYQSSYHHRSRQNLVSLANKWREWRELNADLFDKDGKFEEKLQEAALKLGDKVWGDAQDKDSLLKAFNEVMRIAEQNSQSPFMWGRKNAENIISGVWLITAPKINYSQEQKANAVMNDTVDRSDVVLAERKRNQEEQERKTSEDARKAYITSLYNSQTMNDAVKAVVDRASDARAHNLNPLQALNIISALGMFSDDEREDAADKMMEIARAEASCQKARLDSTAEEVSAIVENFAQIVAIIGLSTQGAAVSTGGGGGGGNNDLPKKPDDDWWKRLKAIIRPSGGVKRGR